jgi:drug/metabolite transporter (DMT)-like permease
MVVRPSQAQKHQTELVRYIVLMIALVAVFLLVAIALSYMQAKSVTIEHASSLASPLILRAWAAYFLAYVVHRQTVKATSLCGDPSKLWNWERYKMKALGIVLIVLGVFALAYGGFSYTHEKKVVDLGPIQASKKETSTVPLPPILGVVAIIGGGVLLFTGKK